MVLKKVSAALTIATLVIATLACGFCWVPTPVPHPTYTLGLTPTPEASHVVPTSTATPYTTTTAKYDVEQNTTLVNDGPGTATRLLLWVALIADVAPYQRALSMEITPQDYEPVTDEYGNSYARFEFHNLGPEEEIAVRIRYQVEVNRLDFDLGDCQGPLPAESTQPERYLESDAEPIVTLAKELEQGKATACEEVEAYYDYVADNVYYSGYDPGDNGALYTLEELEGDCTDFADLLIALSRAGGIPARFLEGVTCCTDGDQSPDDIKHDRLEVYLPESGWVPMDPTWGRTPEKREMYLAGTTPDFVVVTRGRNLSLLDGYHYLYYQWWWDEVPTEISSEEQWRIERVRE
jgi:transglutaminase-like putative cysteine protease